MPKLSAVIGTLIAVALLAAACGGDDGVAPTQTLEPVPTFAGDLRLEQAGGQTLNRFLMRRNVPDRTAFSLCVAGAGGFSVTQAEVAQVRQALDAALVFLPEVPRNVTEGCPPPHAPTGENLTFRQLFGTAFSPRLLMPPEVPSQHQIFVYFVSPDTYAASFDFPYPYVLLSEQRVCEQNRCHGESGGLYVPSDITTGMLSYAIQDYKALAPDWIEVCLAAPELSWCEKFWRGSGETFGSPRLHLVSTRSEIDTSAWPTYASPLGVTVSYPPDWTFVGTFDEAGQPSTTGTHAVIDNGVTDETGELAGTPGVMRVSIGPYPGTFDAELFWNICEEPSEVGPRDLYDGPPDQAIILTVPGQQFELSVLAVLCEYHNLTPARLDSFGFILYIDLPDGRVVEVSSSTVVPTGDDIAVARAIVDSVTLTTTP